MNSNSKHISLLNSSSTSLSKLKDYAELIKLNLNLLVVFTSLFAYLLANGTVSFGNLFMLFIGGILISGASGAFNELLEIEPDSKMKRTKNRPLPDARMSKNEALIISFLALVLGIFILAFQFNTLTLVLSLAVVILYAFVYTPLKKISPIAVLVGAIPGALPPVIGWAAATGTISKEAVFLFILQFIWQFPHFWAVAFMAKDDYAKAGFKMIPNNNIKSRFIALQCIIYTASLIIISYFPYMFHFSSWVACALIAVVALVFTFKAINFYKFFDYASARKLMFASIIYLPLVYIILFIDFLIKR